MTSLARQFSAAAIALFLTASPSLAAGQKVLMLLSSDNGETQTMNLVLANQMQGAGNSVHLLLCGVAGDIALKTAPDVALKPMTPQGLSVRALMEALMKKGATIEVCAIYLPYRKLQPDALVEGVKPASPKDIAAMMVEPAVRVLGQ